MTDNPEHFDGHIDTGSIYESELSTIFDPGEITFLSYATVRSEADWERAKKRLAALGAKPNQVVIHERIKPHWMPRLIWRLVGRWYPWKQESIYTIYGCAWKAKISGEDHD